MDLRPPHYKNRNALMIKEIFKDTSLSTTPFACYEGRGMLQQEWKPSSPGLAISKDVAQSVYADRAMWLPFAAEKYHISPTLADYLIVPVSIILSDIPNRNGKAFPLSTLTEFNTEAGAISYQTWKGKGTYLEHANSIHSEAKGVIFDSILRRAPQYQGNFYTVDLLLGFDRNKDASLASRIHDRKITTYSMGSMCTDYTCSICQKSMRAARGDCGHVSVHNKRPLVSVVGGRLAFLNIAENLTGFECSAVDYPANPMAQSDTVFA